MNKSIKLTPSQIKAYKAGATMFIFPCEQTGFRQKFMARCNHCQKETLQHYLHESNYICLECGHKDIKALGHPDENIRVYYHYDFPLQKGDKDVFIKEEFVDLKELKWVDGLKRRYVYNNTFCEDDYVSIADDDKYVQISSKKTKDDLFWFESSDMKQEQCQHSFKEILDVGVAKVQDIPTCNIWKIMPRSYLHESEYVLDAFSNFYNKQMQEQNINRTYENNDYIFLCEVKVK